MKRTLLLASAIFMLGGAVAQGKTAVVRQDSPTIEASGSNSTKTYESQRPAPEKRLFRSEAVENKITQMQGILKNQRLAWMFANCYPNTLDTTVHFGKDDDGNFRTFVYTGDIHAMWLRDSGAQVWPYIQLANQDEHLKNMLAGVINCQFSLICLDPYANAFNEGPTGSEWESDLTDMNPYDHERNGRSTRTATRSVSPTSTGK